MNKNIFKYDDMKRSEHMAVRNNVGWYFWTHQLIEVTGPDVVPFLDHLYTGNIASLAVGRDRYTTMLNEQGEIIELINPEIIKTEGEQTGLEGCLSVPGKYGIVTRPMVVRVRAQDRYGTEFEVEDEELTARCFCHEIEHLDGHLYTEHCKVLTDEELEQYIREQEKELDEE